MKNAHFISEFIFRNELTKYLFYLNEFPRSNCKLSARKERVPGTDPPSPPRTPWESLVWYAPAAVARKVGSVQVLDVKVTPGQAGPAAEGSADVARVLPSRVGLAVAARLGLQPLLRHQLRRNTRHQHPPGQLGFRPKVGVHHAEVIERVLQHVERALVVVEREGRRRPIHPHVRIEVEAVRAPHVVPVLHDSREREVVIEPALRYSRQDRRLWHLEHAAPQQHAGAARRRGARPIGHGRELARPGAGGHARRAALISKITLALKAVSLAQVRRVDVHCPQAGHQQLLHRQPHAAHHQRAR
mmetsp:Transcript_7377/g.18955  ORF Transcript_7377/g.18955 Transcript_7377/m.18955 type:complete len:301 (+) Transcript_7377:25-927(+)